METDAPKVEEGAGNGEGEGVKSSDGADATAAASEGGLSDERELFYCPRSVLC
jgi:hypothetical protein